MEYPENNFFNLNRREFIYKSALLAGGISLGFSACEGKDKDVSDGIREFIYSVANEDGSFRAGIEPDYPGTSDTGLSGIAAPTYAIILCRTFGWDLPYPDRTVEFFMNSQRADGAFYHRTGSMDPNGPLARLYNTLQGIISLRLLGEKPKYDPMQVIGYFFDGQEYTKLPLYTTSFFPLFYTAMGRKMPANIDNPMREYIIREQNEDGYLQDHVAATFHAAHYFRLTGRTTPKSDAIVARVLRDQKNDGSWQLKEPAWDVHSCFDALFILRQLGSHGDQEIGKAYEKAQSWILQCRKPDGGFTHFPDETVSDMDAVYFQAGGLVETGFLKPQKGLTHEEILGWGHVMDPDKEYSCI